MRGRVRRGLDTGWVEALTNDMRVWFPEEHRGESSELIGNVYRRGSD